MNTNDALSKIPVVSMGAKKASPQQGLYWKNRLVRYGFMVLLILVPILGIFRIDVSSGFVILGRQIWFADFFLVFGFWLTAASLLVVTYSMLGTVFCGWACPQNTFSNWANSVTEKHLGKRAVVDWNNEMSARIANAKNKWGNWVLLSIKMLLVSMLLALIPMLYFNPPGAVWSFITFQEDERLAGSLHWIYTVFVFIALVNLAVIRHYMCRYMCIYRIWQYLFKTRDTLHVEYDESRASECDKCNYCVTSCMVSIDPRQTNTFDSCTNCGECITACNSLHEKKEGVGLLNFKFGRRKNRTIADTAKMTSGKQRAILVAPVFLLGFSLFVWGLWSYQPYQLTVYRAEILHGQQVSNYRVNIANKIYEKKSLTIEVEGLAASMYSLEAENVTFESAGRLDVNLKLSDALPKGLITFIVRVTADDGWTAHYRIQHLVDRG
ncbi:MAG: 4Fe-4S binding protein [Thiotrichaceae bacterium]|nr:4Fe-4S binding protein [Thiotrichaceae bacterium]PCI14797.1 MAG: ferredoxin [Thiotrichales bacterium]